MSESTLIIIAGVLALFGYFAWQVLKEIFVQADELAEADEIRFRQVAAGTEEPRGLMEEIVAGQGRSIYDPAVGRALAETLDVPQVISAEVVQEWISQNDGSDGDRSGAVRFQRMNWDGAPIGSRQATEGFAYTVFELTADDPAKPFVLISKSAISLQYSAAIGRGDFDATDPSATRKWLEARVNEKSNKSLWVDVFMEWADDGNRAVSDSLILGYDMRTRRAYWPAGNKEAVDTGVVGNEQSDYLESEDHRACFCGCGRRVDLTSNTLARSVPGAVALSKSVAFHWPGLIQELRQEGHADGARAAEILQPMFIDSLEEQGLAFLDQIKTDLHELGTLSNGVLFEIESGEIRHWEIRTELFANLFSVSTAEQETILKPALDGEFPPGLLDLYNQKRREQVEALPEPEREELKQVLREQGRWSD